MIETCEIENKVVEWIRDYNFMLREVARLNRLLNTPIFNQKLIATYGDDMAMPKGNSLISQAELKQMSTRERRLYKYEMIIEFLETVSETFENEKQEIIFDCMIDGMSYSEIANHLEYSRDTVRKVKNVMVANIAKKVKKDHFMQKLKSAKIAV